MSGREPIPTYYFAVVLVRRGDRFLLVKERKHGQRWYLPAGRVEPGESLEQGALRETLEETGVPVRLTGLLRLEHLAMGPHVRVRAIYLAEAEGDTPPKSVPDEHTLEARWCSLEEAKQLDLRAPEVVDLVRGVLMGARAFPLAVIAEPGEPFVME